MTIASECRFKPVDTPQNLEHLLSTELNELCKQHQVAKGGTKAEMAERIRLRIYDDNETAKFRASTAKALLLEHSMKYGMTNEQKLKLTKEQDLALIVDLDRRMRERQEREILESELRMDDLFSCDRPSSKAFFFSKRHGDSNKTLCRVACMRRLKGILRPPSWKTYMLMHAIKNGGVGSSSILLSAMGRHLMDNNTSYTRPIREWDT